MEKEFSTGWKATGDGTEVRAFAEWVEDERRYRIDVEVRRLDVTYPAGAGWAEHADTLEEAQKLAERLVEEYLS